jgi:hypothetical protein
MFGCLDLVNFLTHTKYMNTQSGLFVTPMHKPRSGLVSWHHEHLRNVYVWGS